MLCDPLLGGFAGEEQLLILLSSVMGAEGAGAWRFRLSPCGRFIGYYRLRPWWFEGVKRRFEEVTVSLMYSEDERHLEEEWRQADRRLGDRLEGVTLLAFLVLFFASWVFLAIGLFPGFRSLSDTLLVLESGLLLLISGVCIVYMYRLTKRRNELWLDHVKTVEEKRRKRGLE